MKKFLLPVVGLLLGSMAASARTVDVTVDCWEVRYNWKIYRQIFDPVTHELEITPDGTFTLKNYLNSGLDLSFSMTNGRIYNGQESMKDGYFDDEVWDSPLIQFYYPVWQSGLSGDGLREIMKPEASDPSVLSDEPYMYHLMPVDGLKSSSIIKPAVVPKVEISEPVKIAINISVASFLGEDDEGKHYKVYVANKFTLTPAYGSTNGWAIFDMTIPAVSSNVSYVDAADNKIFEGTESVIRLLDDRSTSVSNFLNSGSSIVLRTTGKPLGDDRSAIEFVQGFDSQENADQYQTLESATCDLVGADGKPVSGPVMVRPAGCYAVQTEYLSLNKANYKAYLDIKVGDVTGYVTFDMIGTPIEKGQLYTMTLSQMNKNYKFDPVGECDVVVDVIDDRNFVVYNLLNSTFNVPFVLGDPVENTPSETKPWIASQTLDLADGYWKWAEVRDSNNKPTTSDIYKSIIIPDYPDAVVDGSFVDSADKDVALDDLMIETEPYDGEKYFGVDDVFTYKDGDKTRKEYNIYFSVPGKTYKATWSLPKGAQSGIADIVSDNDNAPVEWFNLQGQRVSGNNLIPGIYIKRQGSKVTKVLVK